MEQTDRTVWEGLRGPGGRGPWGIVLLSQRHRGLEWAGLANLLSVLPPHPPAHWALRPQRQAGRFFRCRSRGHPPAPDSRSRPSLGRAQSLAHACRYLWTAAGRACPDQPTLLGVLIESKTNQKSPGFAQVPRCCQVGLVSASGERGRGASGSGEPPSPTGSGGCTTLDLGHYAGLPSLPPSPGSCLAAGSGGRGSPARLLSGGRKFEVSCGQERKGPSGRRCLASNLRVPSCAQSHREKPQGQLAQGYGHGVPREARGRKGQPQCPQGRICPCEPDPAQGHCPRAPRRVGGLPRTPDHRKPLNLGWSKKRTCRGGRTLSGLGGPTSH